MTTWHRFDWPDRCVTGTIGAPGERTFYLQAKDGRRVISVAFEKQQSAALADGVEAVLDQVMGEPGNPHHVPASAPAGLRDDDPLEQPVFAQFRAGTMNLGWDPSTAQVVIQVFPWLPPPEGDDPLEVEAPEVLEVRLQVGGARAFVAQAREVVDAGRPLCHRCGEPVDPGGHSCPLA
ncbi:MAG: DUF3090 domain-containing protein [Propionibacteriaceae bacterium]|nr:DUF3090 domain-containing protein [Propionibacteriaceae bacterium]